MWLRTLQVLSALVLALFMTGLGTMIWNMPPDQPGSIAPMLMQYGGVFLLAPGLLVASIVDGVHDINFKLVQTANVVICAGLGYVFFRFLEWRRGTGVVLMTSSLPKMHENASVAQASACVPLPFILFSFRETRTQPHTS